MRNIFILLFMLYSTIIFAQKTINVPGDYSTIQTGLNAASEGDTVFVISGTYYENIVWPATKKIKLIGQDSSNTVIDGRGIGRVIQMEYTSVSFNQTTIIQGFKIKNSGGVNQGIYIKNCQPQLKSLEITGNDNGGIYLYNSSSIITAVKIFDNFGSGMILDNSSPIMTDVKIYSNSAKYGGGMHLTRYSKPQMINIEIYSNFAEYSGGGMNLNKSSPTMTDVKIYSNSVSSYYPEAGGGIYLYDNSNPTMTNVLIYSNSASRGGGMYVAASIPIMKDVTIFSNSADIYGGGMYIKSNSTINSGITITENFSNQYGCGIYVEGTGATIKNLNVINNYSTSNNSSGIYLKSSSIVDSCNFSKNNSYSISYEGSTSLVCLNNWYGDTSGPFSLTYNPNGIGDSISANVNPTPWLTEPNIDAPPIPVKDLKVVGSSNTSIEIQWLSSKMSDFLNYKVYYDTDSSGYPYSHTINIGIDTAYTLTGLSPNTKYYIAVTTTDTDGNESWYSLEVNATPFNSPSIVTLASPLNNSQGLVKPIELKWNKGNDTDYYTVEIAKDTLFNDIVTTRTIDIPDTTYQVDSLADLTKYFWRVKGTNTYASSEWSETWSFKTLGKPTTVTQIAPVANAENQPIEIEFKWTKAKDQFDAQISNHVNYTTQRKNIFSSVISNKKAKTIKSISNYWFELNLSPTSEYAFVDSTLADTSVAFYGFENSTEYYWRIRAKNETGWGAFAEWSKFTTIVDTPSVVFLQSPTNNSKGNIKPIELKWYKSYLSESYNLQLSTVEDFTTTLFDSVGITDTNFIANNLTDLTKYYWRIKAKNIGGEAEWSEVWNFTSLGEPTDGIQIFPVPNAVNQPTELNFIWSKAKDKLTSLKGNSILSISNYWFELSIDTTQISFLTDSTITDTTKYVNNLTNSTDYYWRVRAKNEIGWGAYAEWSKFTTIINEPSTTELVLPQNNSVNLLLPIKFEWQKVESVETYSLQVSTDDLFSTSIIDTIGLTDTTITATNLLELENYYWRIKADNIGSASEWSEVWSFATLGVPTAPNLVSPENNRELSDTTNNIEFVWGSVGMVDSYTLEASANESFDSLFVSINDLTDTNYIYSNQLVPGTFYWRVNAKNLAGISDWSNTYSFTITLTDVDRLGNTIPVEYVLHQNYPNPFNPTTMVKYGLPEQSNIKIEIFNTLGQSVGILVNTEKSAGFYETTWNAENLPSGIYLINIRAEGLSSKKSFMQVKKALLLK